MARVETDYTINDQRRGQLATSDLLKVGANGITTAFITEKTGGLSSIFYQQTRDGVVIAEGGAQGSTKGSAVSSLPSGVQVEFIRAERAMQDHAQEPVVVFNAAHR